MHYLNWLHTNELITRVHAVGTQDRLLKRRVEADVVRYGQGEDAGAVLDAVLDEGRQVYMLGNTVAEFVRELTAAR